ncbi:MAG: hypothetical protein AAB444_01475 [Patescibacteria group bacterium]
MATDIMCMTDDKRGNIKLFAKRLPTIPDAEFFGLIRAQNEAAPKEILHLYQEVAQGNTGKNLSAAEPIFEGALQKLNALLSPFAAQKKNLQLIFGLKYHNHILFSAFGDIMAIFIEKREQGDVAVSALHELIEEAADGPFFGRFANGAIETNQSLFFSTREMNTYFTPLRVATTLLSSPNGLWQLKEALTGYDASLPFGAIHILPTRRDAMAPMTSMKGLTATESATDKILTPPLLPDIRSAVSKTTLSGITQLKALLKQAQDRLPELGEQVREFVQKINARRNRIKTPTAADMRRMIPKFRVPKLPDFRIPEINFDRAARYFKKLPTGAKTLSIFCAIALVIFLQSLAYLKLTSGSRAAQAQLNTHVEKIQNNLNEIRAALLYGDEAKGKTVLAETETLFAALAGERTLKQETRDSILQDLDRAKSTLRHESKLTSSSLYTFGDQKRPTSMARLDGTLYLAGDNSLLKLDTSKKTAGVIYQNLNLTLTKILVNEETRSLLLIDKNKGTLIDFSPQKNMSTQDAIPVREASVFASYGKRLYAVGETPKSIYRLTRVNNKLVSNKWLTKPADLSDTVSLAIDGEIYALRDGGGVQKFSGGAAKNFTLDTIDPPVSSGRKIFTTTESDLIYILENKGDRILVYNKKGKLITQYLAPGVGSIYDFIVDEGSKTILLLSDSGVFEAPITHLK